ESWLHRRMIYGKSDNLDFAIVIDDAWLHGVRADFGAGGGKHLSQIAPYMDVLCQELPHSRCQFCHPRRTVEFQRFAAAHDPCGTEQVGKIGGVVRMQMRQEHSINTRWTPLERR